MKTPHDNLKALPDVKLDIKSELRDQGQNESKRKVIAIVGHGGAGAGRLTSRLLWPEKKGK